MIPRNGAQSGDTFFPEVYYKELSRHYSKILSAESLIKYGYFDSLANKFIDRSGNYKEEQYISNDQFYSGIFNLSEFSDWLTKDNKWKEFYFSPERQKVLIKLTLRKFCQLRLMVTVIKIYVSFCLSFMIMLTPYLTTFQRELLSSLMIFKR